MSIKQICSIIILTLFFTLHAKEKDTKTAGSTYCYRCHETIYNEWADNPEKKPCEECHGSGARHSLSPSIKNISRGKTAYKAKYNHRGKGGALSKTADKTTIELFVMPYCPYGIQAEEELLPLLSKWSSSINFRLYHIAHNRNSIADRKQIQQLPQSGKCESELDETLDGTDKFVSLHGIKEVLEGIRQTVIQEIASDFLIGYLHARNRNLDGDWKIAARYSGMSDSLIKLVGNTADTRRGDSLFEINIEESSKRMVNGSPTLYINGREWPEQISVYAIEKLFCNGYTANSEKCKDFPICGTDNDCSKKGFEGKCIDGGTRNAKCTFTPAPIFTVTILNDENCDYCHTGNIVREIFRRFPGAVLKTIDINSNEGKKWISDYRAMVYPAFYFSEAAANSSRFKEISHTFEKSNNQYKLKNSVVKSYYYLNRKKIDNTIILSGSPSSPPFVEIIRRIAPLITDTLTGIKFSLLPVFANNDSEIIDAARTKIIADRYPVSKLFKYLLCKGDAIQKRFEESIPEPESEWKICAAKADIDTIVVTSYLNENSLKKIAKEISRQADSLEISLNEPSFIINNRQKISGYNNFIHRAIRSIVTNRQ